MSKSKHVPKSRRQIVAIGGGFTSPAVMDYVLGLAHKKMPTILFINTATGDSAESLLRVYNKVAGLSCRASHLPFFDRTPPDLEKVIFSQDVVFVGGGNTKSMLAVWREYGLDQILLEAWKRGIILAGSSAGGICWFEGCVTDSYAVNYTALPALGFLKGSCCPHYDGEAGRQETYHRLIKESQLTDGFALDEGVGVHFIGELVHDIVTGKKGSRAYRVTRKNGKIVEKPLKARFVSI